MRIRTRCSRVALAALLVAAWSCIATAQAARTPIAEKDLQSHLAAADWSYNARQWDQAIAAYEEILTEAPALSVCYLRVAEAYGVKQDYKSALATYARLLKIDPANANAIVGMAMTNLENGDMKAGEEWLLKAAEASKSREIYYNLGELKFADGKADEAADWYQKAADTDPSWSKPSFKLALVALQKGNKSLATRMLEKVIAMDRMSPEAVQAATIVAELGRAEAPRIASVAPQMAELTAAH